MPDTPLLQTATGVRKALGDARGRRFKKVSMNIVPTR